MMLPAGMACQCIAGHVDMHVDELCLSRMCSAVQVHADYLASFQRMQTQFGNGVTDGINTYDPNSLQLKLYDYGSSLNSGGHWNAP